MSDELLSLLSLAGCAPGRWRVVACERRPGGRSLLRLNGPAGESLKVRRFADPQAAAAMVRLRDRIGDHPGFARVLALHQVPVPADVPGGNPVGSFVAKSRRRLQHLAGSGALLDAAAICLADDLAQRAPLQAREGLIHFDFCGDNLVWSEERGPVSIDNERLRVGPLASDLGRTMALWSLPEEAFHALLAGYAAAGGPAEVSDLVFWRQVGLVTSAWFRVRHDRALAEPPLRLLRAWAAGQGCR